MHSNPALPDTDKDGVMNELDADDTLKTNDSDGDGLSNDEKTLGTNPLSN